MPDIAFAGKAGAGKTTAAEILTQLGYVRRSFAAPLKDIAAQIWGEAARTDREKLQRLGVAVREIDPDAWCNLLVREVHRRPARSFPICVDDMRFVNEWWALKGAGFVIVRIEADRGRRIDRLKANGKWQDEAQLEHVSETALDPVRPDYTVVNDGDEADLYDRLGDVLLKERRRR